MGGELVQCHPVEVVAIAPEPTHQVVAPGAVGAVADLEGMPTMFDSFHRVARGHHATGEDHHQRQNRQRGAAAMDYRRGTRREGPPLLDCRGRGHDQPHHQRGYECRRGRTVQRRHGVPAMLQTVADVHHRRRSRADADRHRHEQRERAHAPWQQREHEHEHHRCRVQRAATLTEQRHLRQQHRAAGQHASQCPRQPLTAGQQQRRPERHQPLSPRLRWDSRSDTSAVLRRTHA